MRTDSTPCPCDLGQAYAQCCGRWHRGPEFGLAPDAAALMRSRYSAYVLGLPDYLLQSWHPSTRPTTAPVFDPALRWLGLEVRRHVQIDEQHALVEFVARSKLAGRATRLHETSRFVRQDARWWYLDGDLHGTLHGTLRGS